LTLPRIHKFKYTDDNTRLASLDVKNMYTNIPTNKLTEIINLALNNNTGQQISKIFLYM